MASPLSFHQSSFPGHRISLHQLSPSHPQARLPRSAIAYKFIVDGRWMTNDAKPSKADRGFIIDLYTVPPMPVLP